MSSYMQELDTWTLEAVVRPIFGVWRNFHNADREVSDEERDREFNKVVEQVQKAIREKVLESYRNGQKAGDRALSRPPADRRPRQ